MFTERTNKLFEIHIEEMSSWGKRPHKHNFFEIVYVEKGSGYQCINQHEFEYKEGNIFLLPPLDCHSFKIEEHSRFYFISFTDHFFLKEDGQYPDDEESDDEPIWEKTSSIKIDLKWVDSKVSPNPRTVLDKIGDY